jgi:hypothetical protein
MSSHHFVREGQEPALFIVEPHSFEYIQPLLEWAPLVVVSGDAVEEVLSWGIKIDVVLCQTHQVDELSLLLLDQAPISIRPYNVGEVLLHAGLQFLISQEQSGVTIIAREESAVVGISEPYFSKLNITIMTSGIRWSAIPSGNFQKWLEKGIELQVRAITTALSLSGKNYFEKTPNSSAQQSLTIIAVADGIVDISSKGGFWIGESFK